MHILTDVLDGYDSCGRERNRRGELEKLIRWYFGPEHATMAIFVAWHQSELEPLALALGDSGGIGLYGLTPLECGLDPEDAWLLQNPIRNVAWAHKLFMSQGWGRWKVPPCPKAFTEYADS